MNDFEIATSIRAGTTPGGWDGEMPDGWQQGKGAFGGVVIGILTRAMASTMAATEANRALRSLNADLCGPVTPGPLDVRVSSLRQGARISFVDAQMIQGGGVVARASGAFAAARTLGPSRLHALPRVSPPGVRPPWRDVAVLPMGPPLAPVFTQRYEYRSTGPLPYTGGTDARAEGWIRERGAPTVRDEACIVGLLDAWWPAIFAVESGPRAAATISYTMQLVIDPRTLDPEEPLYYRAQSIAGADNFFIELRELWHRDDLVAMNEQTFALLT